MPEEKLGERVAVLEQVAKEQSKRLSKVEESNEAIVKMSVLMEMQAERDAKQNEQLEKFGTVLDSVDRNLTNLNTKYEQMENNIEFMGEEVKSIKKSQAEEAEKTKVDMKVIWTEIVKKTFYIIPSIILAAVLIWLGLK